MRPRQQSNFEIVFGGFLLAVIIVLGWIVLALLQAK